MVKLTRIFGAMVYPSFISNLHTDLYILLVISRYKYTPLYKGYG